MCNTVLRKLRFLIKFLIFYSTKCFVDESCYREVQVSETKVSIPSEEYSSSTKSVKPPSKNDSISLKDRAKERWNKTCRQLYPTGFNSELKCLASLACPIVSVYTTAYFYICWLIQYHI